MQRELVHVIMYSGGASSAYVAKWVIDKFGKENAILFFTDTLWEDKDNYRFMEEVANFLGLGITYRRDGRTPEEVFFEERFLGNARFAKCSEVLKVRQTLIFIEELRLENKEPILYFGIGNHEHHRAESLIRHYEHFPLEPVKCEFPMLETNDAEIKARSTIVNEWGIKLPRMYELGFHHANCSGRCVRAGMHHHANLYLQWPDKYKLQEDMEQRFRDEFDLDVSIMKRNSGPYTLKEFRENVLEKMTKEELIEYAKRKDTDEIPCFCSFS